MKNESQKYHRMLPHSVEAEQGVLGSMLMAPGEVIGNCVERASQAHFYVPAHATIYAILVERWNANQAIDVITLTQVLRDREQLEAVGGAADVTSLFTLLPTAANVNYYLEIVREKYILRQIIATCTEAASRAYGDQEDVKGLLDECQARMLEISQETNSRNTIKKISEGVLDAVDEIEHAHDNRGRTTGLATGIFDYDRMTGGLHPEQMIVIAARPSMGKSAMLDNICEHVAVVQKKAVLQFSLEMSFAQKVMRLLCSDAPLNLQRVRDGFLADSDFPKVTASAGRLNDAPMWIDDTPALSVLDFKARCRRVWRKLAATGTPLALIAVDYLQLMKSLSRRAQENRTLEITEISGALKEIARELRVPIIVAAQLNRGPEDRRGNKPMLSDLRESGAIENDADVVGLLFRPDYYQPENEELKGKAEFIIAKQRNGPVGTINLLFKKEITRFENTTKKQYSNNEEERQQ